MPLLYQGQRDSLEPLLPQGREEGGQQVPGGPRLQQVRGGQDAVPGVHQEGPLRLQDHLLHAGTLFNGKWFF